MCSFNEGYNDIRVKIDCIDRIKEIVAGSSHFKIGKTGQDIHERFDANYRDDYKRIETVYSSTSKTVIDDLEKWLIEYFQTLDKYSRRCDNKVVGGGDMDFSDKYTLYVVVKD
jgi:molybdopterin converting factor small subunit